MSKYGGAGRGKARWAFVEDKIGTDVICRRCGATLASFADKCAADLDEPCEGFRRIDAVVTEFERKSRAA